MSDNTKFVDIRERQSQLFGEAMLPEICMGVRMACNGSADPWPYEQLIEARDFLRDRVSPDAWNRDREDRMDYLVYLMAIEAIVILDKEINHRDNLGGGW